ncbi:MAG: hypothetical protein JWP35_4546 [Caulobacter sp.]|nr:hypothetical protein [Caulobacter sp.]
MTKTALRAATLALVIAAAGMAATSAWAQAGIASEDTNKDGVVTKAEHTAGAEARFKRMDMNHDGVVDATEAGKIKKFLSMRSPKMAAAIDLLDLNHDGKITHAEFIEASDARFGKLDLNHDGQVDKAEMDAAKGAL